MNTYSTFCEAPGCRATVVQRAMSFDGAAAYLRALGWSSVRRDSYGNESFCPAHKDGRTETMQRCSECSKWCSRTLNVCPSCNATPIEAAAATAATYDGTLEG